MNTYDMKPSVVHLCSFVCVVAGMLPLASGASLTPQWPQFRGPSGQSIAPAQTLPNAFGPDHHLKWKTPVPPGHSSPCIWDDRIYLTGHEGLTLKMICLRRSDGKILWTKTRTIGELPRYVHSASAPAAPTPCTDGQRVCFLFGEYGLIVLDPEGSLVWEKVFQPANSMFGYGASPVLIQGKILVNCDGGLRPSLLCLDLANGETIWQADRPGTIVSYSTPYVWPQGNKTEILQGGSGLLVSYDLQTGMEIWRVGNLPGVVCPSPIADEGAVYYGAWTTAHAGGSARISSLFGEEVGLSSRETKDPQAFFDRFDQDKDRRISPAELPPSRALEVFGYADRDQSGFWEFEEFAPAFGEDARWAEGARNILVSIASGGKGDITESHVRWENKKGLPYVASPLLYRNRLYYVKNGGFVTCVDPASGTPHYERARLGVSGEYYASPIGVGDKILFAGKKGSIVILKATDEFEIEARIDLEDSIYATPAVVDNHLYVRSEGFLWSFGQ